jgi:signal transduction histidine kinase
MSLRQKLLIASLALSVLLFFLAEPFIQGQIRDSFKQLEQDRMAEDHRGLATVLHLRSEALTLKVTDYAQWVQTYDYIAGKRPQYVTENFSNIPELMKNISSDFIILRGKDGQIKYQTSIDPKTGELGDLQTQLGDLIKTLPLDESRSGIMNTPLGYVVFASMLVTDAKPNPRTNGTWISGYLLDERSLTELDRVVYGSVKIEPLSELKDEGPEFEVLNLESMRTSGTYPDYLGNPLFKLVLEQPRPTQALLNGMIRSIRIGLALGAAILGLLTYWMIDRLWLGRIRKMTQVLAELEIGKDQFPKLDDSHRDEIHVLASTLNSLFERLQDSQKQINDRNAALAQSAKLASLGEMAAGVAHEINNPLAVIFGKIDQISEHVSRPTLDRERVLSDCAKITKMVQRIVAIIRGLKNFSRSGEADPFTRQSLDSIVNESIALCSERFKSANIPLTIELCSEAWINCRPSQISQIILNLLNNAFDAVEKHQTPWVKLSAQLTEDQIVIRCTDSGTGIPQEIAAKMMQPFFTTKPIGQGTGLGLSISFGIARDHGGELKINTDSPNTEFALTLPRCQTATKGAA